MKKSGPSRARKPTTVLDSHDAHANTRAAVGSGVRWTAPTQVTIQVVQLGSVLILTRLLTPAEFGLVALVTVVTGFFEQVLGDTGTTVALVRNPTITQGLASSVLYWNLLIGAMTCAFLAVWGGTIAEWLGDADAGDLLRALGVLAVVNSLAHVPTALFRRYFQFRRLSMVNLVNTIVTAATSISLAATGWGAWSLVIGTITGSTVALALAWALSDWRPSFYFSRSELGEISGFSTNLSVQNIFGYASYAGDRFIIGKFIGTTSLGYYGLANRLMRYPVQTTAQTYREVVFPNLARLQNNHKAMVMAYQRALTGIAFIIFPICGTVAAVAQPLIGVALTDEWRPTSSILALIAVTAALQAIASTTGSLYNARGRADLSLRWQVGSSIVLVICYSIGARWGVVGVAAGFLIGTALLTPLAFAIPLRLVDAKLAKVMRGTIEIGVGAIVAALVANGVVRVIDGNGGSEFVQLLGGLGASAATYGLYVLALRPPVLKDLRALLKR